MERASLSVSRHNLAQVMLVHISQRDLLECFDIVPSFTVPVLRALDYLIGVKVDASE
jgi:hypothetical protein